MLQGRAILRASLLEQPTLATATVTTWLELQKAVTDAKPGAIITIAAKKPLAVNSTIDITKKITVTGAAVFNVDNGIVKPSSDGNPAVVVNCSGWSTAFSIRCATLTAIVCRPWSKGLISPPS